MKTSTLLLVRGGLGVSLLLHGLVRLPELAGFAAWMVGQFESSWLPEALVRPLGFAIPLAELALGAWLLSGWKTSRAAFAAGGLMILLVAGTCLIENWGALPSQLIHLAFAAFLVEHART